MLVCCEVLLREHSSREQVCIFAGLGCMSYLTSHLFLVVCIALHRITHARVSVSLFSKGISGSHVFVCESMRVVCSGWEPLAAEEIRVEFYEKSNAVIAQMWRGFGTKRV